MDGEQKAKKPKLEIEKSIKEGEAEILLVSKNVFYNPAQEFNRDLSIAVLSLFAEDLRELNDEINNKCEIMKNKNDENNSKCEEIKNTNDEINSKCERVKNLNKDESRIKNDGITILEALSATGLRSIRYAKEIKGIKEIIANDISKEAVKTMTENIRHNGVENIVKPSQEDAILVMYQNRRKGFHAVDLDPYGCPSTFLDAAVQCVINGGILLVTATDMAVLAGNTPETCYVKYGSMSLKTKACHEMALRILLQHIASHAGRHGRYIVPLLSVSVDFYIRVFVKIIGSQLKCKDNACKTGYVYQCKNCESFIVQPMMKNLNKFSRTPLMSDKNCKYCKSEHNVGGPIWISSLHDQTFVSRLLHNIDNMKLNMKKRIKGVLTMINEELDIPLYYTLNRIMSLVKCITPPMVLFRSALLNAGYKVSYSHANKSSIKTDAPTDVIWDIVRAWEKLHPTKRSKDNTQTNNNPALNILDSPINLNVSFKLHPEANPVSRQIGLLRFPENPVENWGPLTRAKMINK